LRSKLVIVVARVRMPVTLAAMAVIVVNQSYAIDLIYQPDPARPSALVTKGPAGARGRAASVVRQGQRSTRAEISVRRRSGQPRHYGNHRAI